MKGNLNRPGVGLIEAIVALALLAVMLTALMPALVNFMRTNTRSDMQTGAVAVAQMQLDALRANEAWPASGTERLVDAGGAIMAATITYEAYCDEDTCYAGANRVQVEVSHRGRTLYRVETVYTQLDASGT